MSGRFAEPMGAGNASALAGKRLHVQILAGFIVGLSAGLIVNLAGAAESSWLTWITAHITQPVGQIFLRLVFMLVLPLVFSALAIAIADMRELRALGRTGWRFAVFAVVGAFVAVALGLVLVNVVRPGEGVDPQVAQTLLTDTASSARAIVGAAGTSADAAGIDVVALIPTNIVQAAADNQLLSVMIFAVILGIGLIRTPGAAAVTFRNTLEGMFDVSMTLIGLVIRAAPFAIACLVFNLAAIFGWDLLAKLGAFVGVVLAALVLHLGFYGPILRVLGRMSPLRFLRQTQEALLVAFSTTSSNATLPTTLMVARDRLNLSPRVARFVLTAGAATCHHGTALFEGVTVLFLAQFFGVNLDFAQQLSVMTICVVASMGVAAVPAGSLPVIVAVLVLFGIPAEGIGLILGVDRFLDMCRTTVNVAGDLTAAVVIDRSEQTQLDGRAVAQQLSASTDQPAEPR